MKATLTAGAVVLGAAALAAGWLLARYMLAVLAVTTTLAELGVEGWARH